MTVQRDLLSGTVRPLPAAVRPALKAGKRIHASCRSRNN